ncbi:endonuclease/exonuclease/phosphatase family protein [Vibrio gallaecicus]|uniref:endonuclease/exonuclease/phosphatase family protein n=1 Tax=Vibrio gallaecicus TaxID=552386 RepID=UPI0010C9BAB2|nr:endonuclease/exonuclease/phosphatase family protein [Vibrio gallaecicus]MDN3616861.1 endonuclease/exonuclease/phosphatase family protein [Vibrio gallaecicus]
MKILKSTLALAISATMLMGCNDETTTNNYLPEVPEVPAPAPVDSEGRIAAFNLSFDRYTYEDLVAEMKLTTVEQTALVDGWKAGTLSEEDTATALKVIQIRNVAAIIQTERPAVIMMSEFNNDGTGTNNDALIAFRLNYLAVPQNSNSIDQDGTVLEPIAFQYFANFATNTGLVSPHDLDNDGTPGQLPGDAWGFGNYHGQYAFALMSQYEIDKDNMRTFQEFKWKDLEGAVIPTITNCDDSWNPIPDGMSCGDEWYTAAEWADMRLSSKNHVDAPILIPQSDGSTETIHLLMSHPTPPIFDTGKNKAQNADEVNFWIQYIEGTSSTVFTDDQGTTGALAADAKFVVMGDLNADPLKGDGDLTAINALMDHDKVNRLATFGPLAPASLGAPECLALGECKSANWDTPNPDQVTSTSGLRLDHVIPSANLTLTETGVYWPATFESGRLLMNDERVGNYGNGKDISSDHRMVWIKADIAN